MTRRVPRSDRRSASTTSSVRRSALLLSGISWLAAGGCGDQDDGPFKCQAGYIRQGADCVPAGGDEAAAAGDYRRGDTAAAIPGDAAAGDPLHPGDALTPGDETQGGDELSGDPIPRNRLVFVTSGEWTGDLASAGGAADGVAGADALCNAAAAGAALPGAYLAYISLSAYVGSSAVRAIDRMAAGGPWYTTTGQLVWSNLQDFIDDWPAVAIKYTEHGAELGSWEYAWTGSTQAGTPSGADCWGWDGTFDTGTTGDPRDRYRFSEESERSCGLTMHLYCMEQ